MQGRSLSGLPGYDRYHIHAVPIHVGGPAYTSALSQFQTNVKGFIGGVGGVVCTKMFRPVEPCGAVYNGETVLNSVTAQGAFAGTIYSAPLIDIGNGDM